MNYRRPKINGGTFFFTLVTYERRKLFSEQRNINLLRKVIQEIKQVHPFKMQAYVLLPDHFHCIWTLPDDDDDFSTRWRLIKSYFTRSCVLPEKYKPTLTRKSKGEQCVWQRRFWEHAIRNDSDFENHAAYIHFNPVKHGYVTDPKDWQQSSIHYYIEKGIYPGNWGGDNMFVLESVQE
jgi:putative transposase